MRLPLTLGLLLTVCAGCDLGQSLFCPPYSAEVVNNGLDDDCDGATDECGLDADCDDARACTQDACLASGLCQHEPVAGNPACQDGDDNPCTEGRCQQGACAATALADGSACPDDGNVCSLDLCSAGACAHPAAADGLACDDGLFCTEGDRCQEGECRGATLRSCEQALPPCVVRFRCDEPGDQCLPVLAEDGASCEDEHYCTTNERCAAGACLAQSDRVCDDADACTLDSCWEFDPLTEEGECRHTLLAESPAMEICGDRRDQDCDGSADECCAASSDFDPPARFPAGDQALTADSADFNADGIPDLVTVNWRADALNVLLGQGSGGRGDGTFGAAVEYPCGDLPEWLVIADFNADGVSDLATANRYSGDVSVLLGGGAAGRGDGTFGPPTSHPVGPAPKHLSAADLDADGILDLVVACRGSVDFSESIGVLRGNGQGGRGDGTFAPVEHPAADFHAGWVTAADLDADGILDLVASDWDESRLHVYHGQGQDGRGDGTFRAPATRVALHSFPRGTAVADLDADAIPDLAVALDADAELQILTGQGSGGIGTATFLQHTLLPVGGSYPFGVQIADLDRDHLADVITADAQSHGLSVFRGLGASGYGNGFLANAVTLSLSEDPAVGGPEGVAVDDFDGDGLLDLAANDTVAGSLFVFRGLGAGARPSGALQPLPGLPLPEEPSAGLSADLDLDGRPDVALAGSGRHLHVRFGVRPGDPGEDALGAPLDLELPGPASALAAADFAFDGIPDLAVALPGSGQVQILRGAGANGRPTRAFSLEGLAAAGAGVSDLVAADLDGDRIPDLATADTAAGTVSVLLGLGADARGTGAFAVPVAYDLGGEPRALAAADVNADAILDLLVVDQAGDQVVVLLGDGDDGRPNGSFSVAQRYPVGDGPVALAPGDFDRDHITDLAVANAGAGTLSVLLGGGAGGRGDGTFAAAAPVAACAEPLAVRAVDLDADDILDLLVACGGEGAIALLPGQGASGRGDGTFAAPRLFPVGGRPAGLLATDQEPNGVQDALALCQETDELVLLLGQADCAAVP
ncbi:MAG TPA: VCBS repeat-containing protein [Myxococcota bacterium]|nr:VCBS repeat-containing protein [Myxococcota bacterium]HRY96702.1 VCBS repeat-containing protein [Myxococcota bacterium]HSA20210.1 VCBS repeat-containing protein [Myxococcota bacterium]